MATCFGVDCPQFEACRGVRFSVPVQTRTEAYNLYPTIGTGDIYQG